MAAHLLGIHVPVKAAEADALTFQNTLDAVKEACELAEHQGLIARVKHAEIPHQLGDLGAGDLGRLVVVFSVAGRVLG
jgi:hypothetical protein